MTSCTDILETEQRRLVRSDQLNGVVFVFVLAFLLQVEIRPMCVCLYVWEGKYLGEGIC